MQNFSTIDLCIFIAYILEIAIVGIFIGRNKKNQNRDTTSDYFLASNKLTWWAVGASLIAANISAEQIIGMSGSGFKIGLGIASYEWMAAITLILVAKFIMPIFLKKGIYTMPQFLEQRYDKRVRTVMAVFWLLVYVFVNLTSILYLGALALENIMGIPMMWGIVGLAVFAAAYSIRGGLKSVAWTDILQVILLIGGGLVTTYVALNMVSGGNGPFQGLSTLFNEAGEKFNMIISRKENPEIWKDLSGIGVLIGGLWIANISYWGFNQYIIQRGLAAKSINEAQKGMIFAAFLKLIIPLIVVIPGIAAFYMHSHGIGNLNIVKPDDAYPALVSLLPIGVKGIAFAALTAAIVSSLASMLNSTSTIFTLDIYKTHSKKEVSEKRLVNIGRLTSLVALIIAVLTARPFLGGLDQAFQFIQEFTGFVSPGVCVIFLLGIFWKKMSANAALWSAILTFVLSATFKFLFPGLPFLWRMALVFVVLCLIAIIISYIDNSKNDDAKAIKLSKEIFHTSTDFNVWALVISAFVAVLYIIFW